MPVAETLANIMLVLAGLVGAAYLVVSIIIWRRDKERR